MAAPDRLTLCWGGSFLAGSLAQLTARLTLLPSAGAAASPQDSPPPDEPSAAASR